MEWRCSKPMSKENVNTIVCSDCDKKVRLCETPYASTDYIVTCGCEHRQADVSDEINNCNLVEPIVGKWANVDYSHRQGRRDSDEDLS